LLTELNKSKEEEFHQSKLDVSFLQKKIGSKERMSTISSCKSGKSRFSKQSKSKAVNVEKDVASIDQILRDCNKIFDPQLRLQQKLCKSGKLKKGKKKRRAQSIEQLLEM